MSQPTSPDIGSFEESLDVTIYPSDDTFLITWALAELQAHTDFITSAAGWDLVNGWPKRQTAAEKTLSKLQAVIGPNSTYLPEVTNLQFKENDYKYSSGMLPLRVLVGMVAPDYSYSFRHGAGVWAIQQDATHDSPGVKLLAHLVDGTLIELPCSDWTSIKKLVIFDNDIHDHIREPSGVNEFLMQIQYCFLIAAANKLNGFDGKKLPVHCKIAGVLESLTSRMALEAGMKADEQQANTELSMPMDGSLVLVDEFFGCESPSS